MPITQKHNALSLLHTRLQQSKLLDNHIYIIPYTPANQKLKEWLDYNQYNYSVGPEYDLLQRHLISCPTDTNTIVRITSDCPLVDPTWVDVAISLFKALDIDYISTYTPASTSKFCNGSDIEVFSFDTLNMLANNFYEQRDKEHVTFPLWDGRAQNSCMTLNSLIQDPINDVRITLDYLEDLTVLRTLGEQLDLESASLSDIVKAYRSSSLSSLNGHFQYDAGWN
ncbi:MULTISPECIES: hypothetical protein [Prochlorococcus]|uniref:hypothetical protein n=1 Tax=Prochlorococcus TaxID=1218 RepID=UPI001F3B9BA8|nr:hypothetical protein [Prochlorococcus marinus]